MKKTNDCLFMIERLKSLSLCIDGEEIQQILLL